MGRRRADATAELGAIKSEPPRKPNEPSNAAGEPSGADSGGNAPGGGTGGTVVDLAGTGPAGGDSGSQPERTKRKYTPRAGTTKAETEKLDLTEFIAENLFAAHAFLAGLSGVDILAIEKSEADQVGGAIQQVARHYDIPGVNTKTVDWVRLARTLGMVYGTRLFAARAARPKPSPVTAKPGATVMREANGRGREAPAGMAWNSPGPGLPDVLMPI